MNNKQTLNHFVEGLQEYMEVNSTGQGMGYLYGVLSSLQLSNHELELLQNFTQGMKESVEKTLGHVS
jgi:hypothetical protein